MKRYTLLLVFLSLTFALSAQNDGQDKDDYSRQYNKLYKSYLKEPTNVATMLEMALFYSDTLNPMLDYLALSSFFPINGMNSRQPRLGKTMSCMLSSRMRPCPTWE